jgi:hypothetical protein
MKKLILAFGLVATCFVTAFSQGKSVTGVVTSADENVGLPGVTVVEKGTQNATFTDIDGRYTLMVASNEAVLTFSFIGYVKKRENCCRCDCY